VLPRAAICQIDPTGPVPDATAGSTLPPESCKGAVAARSCHQERILSSYQVLQKSGLNCANLWQCSNLDLLYIIAFRNLFTIPCGRKTCHCTPALQKSPSLSIFSFSSHSKPSRYFPYSLEHVNFCSRARRWKDREFREF
jgi:hypothetical protein